MKTVSAFQGYTESKVGRQKFTNLDTVGVPAGCGNRQESRQLP